LLNKDRNTIIRKKSPKKELTIDAADGAKSVTKTKKNKQMNVKKYKAKSAVDLSK